MSETKNDMFDDISKKVGESAKNISKKAGEIAKVSKIKLEIFGLNQKIKECKLKIGDIVYNEKLYDISKDVEDYIKEIDKLNCDIKDVEKEMEEVKNKREEK